MTDEYIAEMKRRCDIMLKASFGEELARKWWDTGNIGFNGATPRQVWQREPFLVYDYLMKRV